MSKQEKIKKQGVIIEALPSLHFKIKLEDGKEIIARLAGKLRIFRIKILPGDKVTVEMSHYDNTRGRINIANIFANGVKNKDNAYNNTVAKKTYQPLSHFVSCHSSLTCGGLMKRTKGAQIKTLRN